MNVGRTTAVMAVLLWMIAGASVRAQEATLSDPDRLEQVLVQGEHDKVPSEAVLDVGSPQSIIGSDVIHQVASPLGDFGTVLNFAPSYVSSAPNGPGFDAAKNQTLRGFVDGQFNITMDGIPFQDPDNFGHHSTSFFPVTELNYVVEDRSPGGAPDLGYASFGGSINLHSQPIAETAGARVFGTYGSFNQALVGATLNSAAPQASGQTGVVGTAQYSRSDGAMALSPGDKLDLLVKSESLIGDARLTAMYTYDSYHFYNPGSITTTDLALYGSAFGFNDDPASPNYYGYSATARSSDFGYVKLEAARSGGWRFEDKVYTFAYRNFGLSLKGDQTSSPIGSGFAGIAPTDIAGKETWEDYRTVGNDARVQHEDPYGVLMAGIWVEHSWQNESRDGLDLTTGLLYDANKKGQSPIYFDFDAHLNTLQPYAQYVWHPIDPLKLRFGVRYRSVTRDFDASVVSNFLPATPGTVERTVDAWLPSFDATYRLATNTDLTAQISRGSLVPSQSFFYTSNPAGGNQANAETATASQLGVVRQTDSYGIGIDAYNIDFDNYVSTITLDNNTEYVNSGSVRYRGIEGEGHLKLGAGLTFVANASVLRATFQQSGIVSAVQYAGATIPYAPPYTGLVGIVYGHGPWGGSLLAKFVGTEYQGKNGSDDGFTYRVNAYSYTNATLTRNLSNAVGLRNLRATFAVNNLWNSDAVTDNAGPSVLGPNLVNVLARRNYMISLVADL